MIDLILHLRLKILPTQQEFLTLKHINCIIKTKPESMICIVLESTGSWHPDLILGLGSN